MLDPNKHYRRWPRTVDSNFMTIISPEKKPEEISWTARLGLRF